MRLIHYSAEPLGEIRSKVQSTRLRWFKPDGLWVSVEGDDDWKSWCESEDFRVETLRCAHEVTLAENARILRIASADEIDAFTNEFHIPGEHSRHRYDIRWGDVAERWQGIIIAPYIWERRLGTSWYYGWDCASGCIWDAGAIAEVRLIG